MNESPDQEIMIPPGNVRLTTPGSRHLGVTYIAAETTGWCNRSCSFCPANKWPETSQKGTVMTPEVFEKFVQDLENWKKGGYCGGLSLYGDNEPLLDKNIVSRYWSIKDRVPGALMSLTTNADILTLEKTIELIGVGVVSILCNCYELRTLNKVNLIAAELSSRNLAEISRPQPGGFHPMVWRKGKSVFIVHDATKVGKTSRSYTTRAGNVPGAAPITPLRKNCHRPWTHIHLKWNGNLVLCCQDWKEETVIGNIMDTPLSVLYNSEKIEDIRRHLWKKQRDGTFCAKCDWGD